MAGEASAAPTVDDFPDAATPNQAATLAAEATTVTTETIPAVTVPAAAVLRVLILPKKPLVGIFKEYCRHYYPRLK